MSKSDSGSNSESEIEDIGDRDIDELEVEEYVQHGAEVEPDMESFYVLDDVDDNDPLTEPYMDKPLADEVWLEQYEKNKAEKMRQMEELQKRLQGLTLTSSW